MEIAITQAATPLEKHFPLSLPVPHVYPFSQQYVSPQLKWSEGQEEIVPPVFMGWPTVMHAEAASGKAPEAE